VDQVEIVSFGYDHGGPPAATVVLDLRGHTFPPGLPRDVTDVGSSAAERAVMNGPGGLWQLTRAIADVVWSYLEPPRVGPVRIALGCGDGQRLAPITARTLGRQLDWAPSMTVTVTHRDLAGPGQPGAGGRR